MDVQTVESPGYVRRVPYFAQLRWTSVFAGTVVGIAAYLTLALFGIALGLSTMEPQALGALGPGPVIAAIWTGLSLLIAAFAGGYVAARSTGLSRKSDGVLHGLVTWGTITVLFAWIATNTLGMVVATTVTGLAQGGEARAESLLGGREGVDADAIAALQERVQAGDRAGAQQILEERMGIAPAPAAEIADELFALAGPENQGETAAASVEGLGTLSWWLFLALLLSLLFGLWGGAAGAKSVSRRATEDHSDERYLRVYP